MLWTSCSSCSRTALEESLSFLSGESLNEAWFSFLLCTHYSLQDGEVGAPKPPSLVLLSARRPFAATFFIPLWTPAVQCRADRTGKTTPWWKVTLPVMAELLREQKNIMTLSKNTAFDTFITTGWLCRIVISFEPFLLPWRGPISLFFANLFHENGAPQLIPTFWTLNLKDIVKKLVLTHPW